MIRRFLDARRRAKTRTRTDIDKRLAALRLGMTAYEREAEARRRRASNALLLAFIAISAACVVFGALDPIFDTLDQILRALA